MIKIYKVKNCDKLNDWDLEKVRKILAPADFFIYNYNNGGYDGTGIAIWRENKKYGYAYLGHCSCNGPVEDLNSIMYTLTQLRKLSKSGEYEWEYAPLVMEKLNTLLVKEK